MIASLNLAIPAGHVLHWKHRPDGVMEIRVMLFLTPNAARWVAKTEALRGAIPTPPQ
jgi:hypothetical protein